MPRLQPLIEKLARFGVLLLCLGAVTALLGSGSRASEPAAQSDNRLSIDQMTLLDDQRELKIGDQLVYQVIEERKEQPTFLFVNSKGNVQVPLIGSVPAVGKTCQSLAYDIKKELKKDFFYQATVILRLQEGQNSRGTIYLVGEGVKQQGSMGLPPDRILTVYDAILKAGGVTAQAKASEVVVIRKTPNAAEEQKEISIDVAKMLQEGPGEENMPLQPEDIVRVPAKEHSERQFMVLGAVNQEGVYQVPAVGNVMVSEAIMQAGGFTEYANKSRVKLIRNGSSEADDVSQKKSTELVNVARVLNEGQRGEDRTVKPGDIIRVPEKWFNF